MRILFLTYQGDIAGSTNSIIYLTRGLADLGHQVWVGCRQESLLYRTLLNSRVKLIPMTFKSKLDWRCIKHIARIVRKYQIEIINAQSSKDRYLSIFAKIFYRLPVKLVHTRRQVPLSAGGRMHSWFYQAGTDKIIIISEALKQIFLKNGYREDHLKVIHNGTPGTRYQLIDMRKVQALRQRYQLEGKTVIGSVSRQKNQDQIVEALALLDPEIKLLLVGVPEGFCDQTAVRLGLKDRIIYAGVVDREEVLNYYKLMEINVLASTMDGFGLVLVEAMALEVPVIATDYAGIRDVVINEENGLLFNDKDISGLAAQIKRLLSDPDLRARLIAKGKKTALEDFSIEKTISNYETFFRELLQQ